MLLCLLPLLAAVSGYTGTCRELPASYYTPDVIDFEWKFNGDFWDMPHWEHVKIDFDFNNANKFEDFVINDETYVLLHFTEGVIGGGQVGGWGGDFGYNPLVMDTVYDPIDEWLVWPSGGCEDCLFMSGLMGPISNPGHPNGWGWTEMNVLYFELKNGASGGNPTLEWEWEMHFNIEDDMCWGCDFEDGWLCCLEKIEICQGIKYPNPTVSGLSPGNVAIPQSEYVVVPLSAVEGENVHYTAITGHGRSFSNAPPTLEALPPITTQTLQMAFSGTTPVNTDSYIQAGFDGEFVEETIFSPMASMDREDPSMNVYNFHFDGEYCVHELCTGANEWYMNFMIIFDGSDWHAPKVQWISLVNPAESQAPPAVAPPSTPLTAGTCYSGNWTVYMNEDDPSDGIDDNTLSHYQNGNHINCNAISAVQVRDPTDPDATTTLESLTMDPLTGITCNNSMQADGLCIDYEVRFCCEGCCPLLNVSGNAELTDYYEDYPGLYKLQDDMFNDMITYKQIAGYDEVGSIEYGQGVIYYWADVGWLLGANTFTYSYFSDGIEERCPQFAPSNWTNEVYGTQLLVECLPIYPSCNDVECVENAYCTMTEDGPLCVCKEGYELYEDGQCLTSENCTDGICEDGTCGPNDEWSVWMNSDLPEGTGDWETLGGFAQSMACLNPSAIQAQRTDGSTDNLVTHISKEIGFWCVNSEQIGFIGLFGAACSDFEVRFCCPKYAIGSDCTDDEYDWTTWQNLDTPDGLGDWETTSHFGENDVCSNPIGSEARIAANSTGASNVTHIQNDGFWCINEEQDNGAECADFEARFCCPGVVKDDTNTSYIMDGTCDDANYDWTVWLNTDSPVGSDGDWETLGKMARMNVCSSPSGIQARTSGPGATSNVHIHKDAGFWCENEENSEDCADFEVRFCCPQFKTGECTEGNSQWTGWYNDEWDKKNERIWVSNRDELELLQTYGDGAACANPTEAEIRPRPTGSTSYQTTMWMYAGNLVHHLSPEGYRCYNEEQTGEYFCIDMEVRFCCPDQLSTGDCDGPGEQWTGWLDNDTPDEDGDWETRRSFAPKATCENPTSIQARPTDDGSTEYTHIDNDMGFYCLNSEQAFGGLCANFEVRFCCPMMQVGECNKKGWEWTSWLNRDDPAGTGDWENLHSYEPNEACHNPSAVRAQDMLVGTSGAGTSDMVTHLDLSGFYCINDEQTNGLECSDFAVSFCCPVDEDVTCEDAVCDENEWCLETGEGPLCKCGDDDFNDDHDAYDFVEYEDGECIENVIPTIEANGTITIERGNCDTAGFEWTNAMSKDTPADGGDFEFIHSYKSYEACANPTGIRATAMDSGAGFWPIHIDLTMGFWCVNSEQTGGACEDFAVEFCCPKTATADCPSTGYSWSEWYNVDQPDLSGDWELHSKDMCTNPLAVKAETLSGNAFNNMTHIDTNIGFWCVNDENTDDCEDYRVSFCCPVMAEGTCDAYGHSWSAWLNIDDAGGLGDMEVKSSYSEFQVCDAPTGIVAQVFNGTETAAFKRVSTQEGFVCQNDIFNTCADYEVTWCCPKWGHGNLHCDIKGYEWTSWIDGDDPASSTGDWETRTSYVERAVCSNPIGIQAYPIDLGSTEVTHIDTDIGFWCVNEEQSNGDCADFAARFCCPKFDDGSCDIDGYEWTDWLDRDDPTGEGDYETRHDYSTDQVCGNPIAISAQPRTSGASDVTHVDIEFGFWCINDEQTDGYCADFEVRFCCPKKIERSCDAEGYEWTVWLDRDDPVETGDWENKDGFPANVVCSNPTAIEAQVKSGSWGSTKVTHMDNSQGFWCINDEQPKDAACADFEVRFCCPEEYSDPCASAGLICGEDQHILYQTVNETVSECVCACNPGMKSNSTEDKIGDDWECENMHGTCVKLYKTEKTWEDALSFCNAIGADLPSVPSSTYQDWLDDMWSGSYWLGLNDIDVPNTFSYTNGDDNLYQSWGPNQPLTFDPYNCVQIRPGGKWSTGRCDQTSNFFCQMKKSTQICIADVPCQASLTECVDFDTCINPNGAMNKLDRAHCAGTYCAQCNDPSRFFVTMETTLADVDCPYNSNEAGDGVFVECAASGAYPANNGGTTGSIACVCDGKNLCEWQSEDFKGDITEDGVCITDHTCPVTPFFAYEGEMVFTRNRFLTHPTFNTLQSDLYDSSMTEVLGRIEVSALNGPTDWGTYDWSQGHHLVLVWPSYLEEHVNICPYGDYYDAAESDHGDGDVQVFETFTNNLILRDGSDRDLMQNLEIVLNIRHDYDLDIEDITELLVFRVAMIPKTWTDAYGDTIKKTAGEISDCLNMLADNKFKVDGQFRKSAKKPSKERVKINAPKPVKINSIKPTKPTGNKWNKNKNKNNKDKDNKNGDNKWKNKWKNQPKLSPEQYKHKQAARMVRLGHM